MERKHFECDCTEVSHMIRITKDLYWEQAGGCALIIETQLNYHLPWYKRLWPAVKYVFGMRCTVAPWAETILNKKQVEELKKFLEI